MIIRRLAQNVFWVQTQYYVFLLSYTTPVAYSVAQPGPADPQGWYVTTAKHSTTTSKHLGQWARVVAGSVAQEHIDALYGAI